MTPRGIRGGCGGGLQIASGVAMRPVKGQGMAIYRNIDV
jgi:hypothetical protein